MGGVELGVALVGGVTLGTLSGLTPGVHANAFALLLAGIASSLPGSQLAVGVTVLAAGVTHSFVDVVPSIALGVPDAAMAATALPGHRLVLAGRGREALRISALGSLLACALAIVAAWPVTHAMRTLLPVLQTHLPVVLIAATILLALTERTWHQRTAALAVATLAGAFGIATLDLDVGGPISGSILTALFGGLFGAPILLDALDGDGIPPQDDTSIQTRPRTLTTAALTGTAGGSAVGYLPGVSSGVAAVLALTATPGDDTDRTYLATVSGVNTANAIFAVYALAAFDTPRTGVLVAYDQVGASAPLTLLTTIIALTGLTSALIVITIGDHYLTIIATTNPHHVITTALTVLITTAWLFAGLTGLTVFTIATLIGLLPTRLHVKRVHLMSVLVIPIALTT